MPDIFGRERHEYSHIAAIAQMGENAWDQHQRALAAQRGENVRPHDFQALRVRAVNDGPSIAWFQSNLMAIQSAVDEIMYTEYRLPEMVQINTCLLYTSDAADE